MAHVQPDLPANENAIRAPKAVQRALKVFCGCLGGAGYRVVDRERRPGFAQAVNSEVQLAHQGSRLRERVRGRCCDSPRRQDGVRRA